MTHFFIRTALSGAHLRPTISSSLKSIEPLETQYSEELPLLIRSVDSTILNHLYLILGNLFVFSIAGVESWAWRSDRLIKSVEAMTLDLGIDELEGQTHGQSSEAP